MIAARRHGTIWTIPERQIVRQGFGEMDVSSANWNGERVETLLQGMGKRCVCIHLRIE